jgi:hypothetical protein
MGGLRMTHTKFNGLSAKREMRKETHPTNMRKKTNTNAEKTPFSSPEQFSPVEN